MLFWTRYVKSVRRKVMHACLRMCGFKLTTVDVENKVAHARKGSGIKEAREGAMVSHATKRGSSCRSLWLFLLQ